jgi:5-methylcytosine-specific restriction endonuclease McrA
MTRRCLDCGRRTKDSRCATCQARIGRSTYHWQQTRAARKEIDGHRCVYCGSTEDLTVDLLGGHHSTATVLNCVTACRHCNSSRG